LIALREWPSFRNRVWAEFALIRESLNTVLDSEDQVENAYRSGLAVEQIARLEPSLLELVALKGNISAAYRAAETIQDQAVLRHIADKANHARIARLAEEVLFSMEGRST